MPRTAVRTGVDLGGTKIEAAVLSSDEGILARQRCPTPQGDYTATVEAVGALIEQVEAQAGAQAAHVGVGGPGSIDPDSGLHRNANSTMLNGRPLQKDLADAIGREVRLANDADCLALSEAFDGAGQGCRCVFAVILGTGIGGGLVVDGRLHTGPNKLGGEFGHTALPRPRSGEVPGPRCWCGMESCLEAWLAGPVIEARWRALGHDPRRATAIAAAASEGETDAADMIEQWLDRLARALGGIVTVLDPDVIVLGGGLSVIDALYTSLPERLGAWTFNGTCRTALRRAHHGDSSGVLGAARL